MNAPSSRKIGRRPSGADGRPAGRRGIAALVVLALFVMFSSIGLGLIFLTQVSLHAGRARKNLTVLDVLAENGIKQEFAALASLLSSRTFPLGLDDLRAEAWLLDPAPNSTELLEYALDIKTPCSSSGGRGAQTWKAKSEFILGSHRSREIWLQAEFRVLISARGEIKTLPAARSASLEASLEIAAGSVPLALFPVLWDADAGDGNPAEPPSTDRLVINAGPGLNHLARVLKSDERLLPRFAGPALEKALNIKLFKPQDLSPAMLRPVLGLEESPDPIPEGVYLVRHDLGLGGLYVQGDLRELVTGIEEDCQVLCLRSRESEYVLKFNPRLNLTEFDSPLGRETFDTLPQQVIVVDGKIEALGGGRIDGAGNLRLCPDEEIPSILSGVRLTIVSTDPVIISSHLIHQGVTWEKGIPYVKENQSELVIFPGGTGHASAAGGEAGLFIGATAPRDLKIQGEILSPGAGFHVLGPAGSVHLLGSLQTSNFRLNDSRLELHHQPGLLDSENSAACEIRTASPVVLVSCFKPTAWRDDE